MVKGSFGTTEHETGSTRLYLGNLPRDGMLSGYPDHPFSQFPFVAEISCSGTCQKVPEHRGTLLLLNSAVLNARSYRISRKKTVLTKRS